jgi:AmmeMemoRadiSam system protein B
MTVACPRLRPLEIFPTELEGRRVLCLRDPAGLTDRVAFLPGAAVAILSACDGQRTAAEVAAHAAARLGTPVSEDQVHELLDQLDDGLFLDTPRFHAHHQALLDEFRARPVRDASHAGLSYAGDTGDLVHFLDAQLEGARGRAGAAAPEAPPAGLIAPHIDFARGGPVYGDAYLPLCGAAAAYDLIVVFGTDHNGVRHPFTLTRKSYATPLGVVPTDVDLVDALASDLAGADGDALFDDEFHHAREHSIEFQAVWLRHVMGAGMPPILPVLCGPFSEAVPGARVKPRVRGLLAALKARTAGRRVLVVAGADLAHVGPRFGDGPFRARERDELAAADRRALDRVAAGDADGFYAAIVGDGDRFKVCGTAPIYATLALLDLHRGHAPRRGELLAYDQCPADDGPVSWVSITAMTLY